MREVEILGLILMLYDYEPQLGEAQVIGIKTDSKLYFPTHLLAQPYNYLERKGYFKSSGLPTKKLLNLLRVYNIEIKQLKELQEEFNK